MTLLKDWHQIRLQDVPASPWKNGGGTTQSLICWPSPSQWVFRMSVARIDSDGPFSEFMGVERGMVRVVDESGEDYLYPAASFRILSEADSQLLERSLARLAA